jgi:hypothetical protein
MVRRIAAAALVVSAAGIVFLVVAEFEETGADQQGLTTDH